MTRITSLLLLTLFLNSCNTTKVIYVADSYATCKNSKSEKCLQVKENKEDDWTTIPNLIEGFDYKEGYTHKIEVEISKTKNASDNESQLKYKLTKILYQEKSKTSQTKTAFIGKWKVFSLAGMGKVKKTPTLNIDTSSSKISGNAGCNTYGTTYTLHGKNITFETPVSTKMFCPSMSIEKTFFGCLQNTAYYKIIDGNLVFYSKDDKEQITCSKAATNDSKK